VLSIPVSPVYCLLFGALISPTDPIAVLALLKHIGAPKPLEVTIAGESLFNDGVGVVIFLGVLEVAVSGRDSSAGRFALLFAREAVGGAAFGLAIGYLAYRLIKSVDQYEVEIMLSLALAAGGYALANNLHLSGPMAMVVAGLLIGNQGRLFAMSPTTVERLDLFWKLIDEILNAVLFVLLGLEVLAVRFTGRHLAAGLLAIPIVLLARLLSVAGPIRLLRREPMARGAVRVLTWGGLRGALSVAMALSLPREVGGEPVAAREVLVVMTYVVVVFSILVQGLTIGPLARRWLAINKPAYPRGEISRHLDPPQEASGTPQKATD
jgi:CPA1 family monovalent cation:H+ antiporter